MNQDSQAAKHTFNTITLFDETVLIISWATPENLFLTKKSQSQWINISTIQSLITYYEYHITTIRVVFGQPTTDLQGRHKLS